MDSLEDIGLTAANRRFEISIERSAASLEQIGIAMAKHKSGDAYLIIRALESLLERVKNQNLAKATHQIEERIKKVNEALSKSGE